MSNHGGWTRRLDKLEKALPDPPAGSPYWHDSLQRLGYALRLGDREPDYAEAIRAYGELRPPYGDEAERLHEHLCELVGRAADKTPPCSAAEFVDLAGWLADCGDTLPSAGWPKAINLGGGATATPSDLRWRAGLGPTAGGCGKLAETLRKLKAKYPDGSAAESAQGERERTSSPRRWPPSVVRDDSDFDAAGAAEPTRPIDPGAV